MKKIACFLFLSVCLYSNIKGQEIKIDKLDKDLTFTGTKAVQDDSKSDTTGQLILSGYISTYYAHYNDSVGLSNYQKFPTVSPYSDRIGANLIQFGGKYTSERFRGTFMLHWGDIPESAWSSKYNVIQEANVGVKLAPKLWFDAGLFRTHIGLESIQPRENIATSIAITTYYEPYFLSGVKLTYSLSDKIALQINGFNGFNTFIETNKNKAFGFSAVITPVENLNITLNTITCDESSDNDKKKQQRLYNNLYLVYQSQHMDIGAEYNLGIQQNTGLVDTAKTAIMQSALLAIKYKFNKHYAIYSRVDYFNDPDEILTGPIENSDHQIVGLNVKGYTLGLELKVIQNSYIRLEGRTLRTKPDEDIFIVNNKPTSHREEILGSIGVWF